MITPERVIDIFGAVWTCTGHTYYRCLGEDGQVAYLPVAAFHEEVKQKYPGAGPTREDETNTPPARVLTWILRADCLQDFGRYEKCQKSATVLCIQKGSNLTALRFNKAAKERGEARPPRET